ncbi:hypothetical protein K469DRAFT_692998 [Zopfia rhizophila CBS 207.26]|uniref:Uncharacterized protein n=1 Tax=Zopfia rhizophila CBS 207.26 TaxID=1314779 RepID=A0A6A6EPH9_9PEZI|nr:hypothetical protein K469DRAFT_692998 [Zopfia rhizophila CBS 207.26]
MSTTAPAQNSLAKKNGREWAEKKRNKAIKQANERANPVEAEAPAGDVGASPASSFVTAVSDTKAYTMSQKSWTLLNEISNTQEDFKESDSLIEELVDYTLLAKRSTVPDTAMNPL